MNYETAKHNAMLRCPYARTSLSTGLVTACKRNYSACKIPDCPRRLI